MSTIAAIDCSYSARARRRKDTPVNGLLARGIIAGIRSGRVKHTPTAHNYRIAIP